MGAPAYKRLSADEKKERVQELMGTITAGVQAVKSSDDWTRFLKLASTFHTYSLNNQWLIFNQKIDATRVAGFETWKKLNRVVRKGEKGIRIFAPVPWKSDAPDPVTGEVKRGIWFKVVSVFDVVQTEVLPGKEDLYQIPRNLCTLVEGQEADGALAYAKLKLYAETELKVRVEEPELPLEGYNGLTDGSRIVVASNRPVAQRAKTMAHEIGHVVMHSKDGKIEPGHEKGRMEVEAESVAFVVMHVLGIDSSGYSFPYVATWTKDKDHVEEVKGALANVMRASQQILKALGEDEQE